MNTIVKNRSTQFVLALAAASVLGLSGCAAGGGDGEPSAQATDTSTAVPAGASTTDGQQKLTVEDPWMKAADSGMTAVFGTLSNDGDSPVTLSGADANGIAQSAQLHETVMDEATGSTVMQEMTEPLVIEPGESVTLEPGADHIMLMDLSCAPMAGQNLSIQLTYVDGESQSVEVPVRDYQGAQEQYSHEGDGSTTSPSSMPSHMATAMPSADSMEGMHSTEGAELPMCEESQ